MRRVLPLLALVSLALAPAPVPKPSAGEIDLEKLQGDWVVTKGTCNGAALAAEDITGIRVTKGRMEISGRDCNTWAVTLDAKPSPKRFEAVTFAGHPSRMTLVGTYALNGDSLTLSYRLHSPLVFIRAEVPAVDTPAGWELTLKRKKP